MTTGIGYQVAVCATPFFDLLDEEEESLAVQVAQATDASAANLAMEASRRRLAQGVDHVVRSLPAPVRSDQAVSRAVAYALVGLVDGRMLHRPAGGLEQWRERLLEFELYGSALAGQEVIAEAQAAARGITDAGAVAADKRVDLAPFYLGVLRAGFEGSLRGDSVGLASLIAMLEDVVGGHRGDPLEAAPGVRPTRVGMAPMPLAALGLAAWLIAGFAVWFVLLGQPFEESERSAQRMAAGLPAAASDPLERSIGPSGLSAPEERDD